MTKIVPVQNEFLFYASADGSSSMQILIAADTVGVTQKAMAKIFGTSRGNIAIHLGNVL